MAPLFFEGLSVRLPAGVRIQVDRIAQNLGLATQQLLDLEMAKNVARRPEYEAESRDVFERGAALPREPIHAMALWAFRAFQVAEARDHVTGAWRRKGAYEEVPADLMAKIREVYPGCNVHDVARRFIDEGLDRDGAE